MSDGTVRFADFEFAPRQRRLTRSGQAVRVGSRALDILAALLAQAGSVVSKEKLVASVWPDTFVDEANLRVHMSALRKALSGGDAAEPLIENVPGRGYAFVGQVTRLGDVPTTPPPADDRPRSNLPYATVLPIGREAFVAGVTEQLQASRLVTVTGPGGIGKTTVALAAARQGLTRYPDGVVFVDFGAVSDQQMVGTEVRSALERASRSATPVGDAVSFLAGRQVLLVLDNCEHLIEPVANLAVQLLRTCPDVRILATSREPLRVPSEWVVRLPSLELPPETGAATAAEIATFPAVRLFVDRVSETLGGFELRDADAPLVAEICRRLDGIALAIELAAGRIETIGLSGLADALDDRFKLLRQGRRTALPRHQTLRATLDWSFGMLSEPEQGVLRKLAIFSGGFTGPAAIAVAAGGELASLDVEDILAGLTAKSLVTVDSRATGIRYRLLETTRSYCAEKLAEAGEYDQAARRHAMFYLELFETAASEWDRGPASDWRDVQAADLGNLRAALDWAFRESEPEAIRLTVAAIPLWFQLSLVGERLLAAQRAVAALDRHANPDRRQRMHLNVVLGWPQMHAVADVESGPAAWRTVLEIAEELGDIDYRLRALWALWVDRTNSADHPAGLALAQRFLAAAEVRPDDELVGHRLVGRSLHLLGQQELARDRTEHMLGRYASASRESHAVRFQYDQRALAQSTLSRILLLQGYRDEAIDLAHAMVADVIAGNDVGSACDVLSDGACIVALLSENWQFAVDCIALLRERSAQGEMDVWSAYGRVGSAILLIDAGQVDTGVSELSSALGQLESSGFLVHFAPFRSTLALGLARSGRLLEAISVMDAELARCRSASEGWYLPELMRVRAELGAAASIEGPERRLEQLGQALALATEQGALEWELRIGTSLARTLALQEPSPLRASLQRLAIRGRQGYSSPFTERLERVLAGREVHAPASFTTLY